MDKRLLACKTVVHFCVFQANRGKRKVSVRRESCARGLGALRMTKASRY